MKKILLASFILLTSNVLSQHFKININAVDYDGVYYLNNNFDTTFTKDSLYIVVTPGSHFLNTGATVEKAYINFVVDNNGKVTSLSPMESAELINNTITFKTTEIIIDPEKYEGNYRLSFLKTSTRGKNSYKVIKNIIYNLGNGSGAVCENNKYNYFYFFVDEKGKISIEDKNPCSIINDNEVHLKTKEYIHDFSQYNAKDDRFKVTGYGWKTIKGKGKFFFINSLCLAILYHKADGSEVVLKFVP